MRTKTLNIYGKKIKLKRSPIAMQGMMGYYDALQRVIVIDSDLEGRDFIDTFMHELFHCMCHVLGLRQAQLSLDLEEILAENVSQLFCDVLDEVSFCDESTREKKRKKRRT